MKTIKISTPFLLTTGLLLITLLTAACQPAVYLMPTPVGITSSNLDPFARTPEELRDSDIQVGYATNRIPIGVKQSRIYTTKFDQNLRMGLAKVQIGSGEESWEEVRQLSLATTPKDEILLSLSGVEEMAELRAEDSLDELRPEIAQLMRTFNEVIEKSRWKEVTLYVHGANNNFYRTASQAAQYAHFIGRQALVILYSWPSAESIIRYGKDIANIRETVPTLARYIRLLAKHSTVRRINILAYSAGAKLVTQTLALLGEDTGIPDRKAYKDSLRLGSIYFAAPDTDLEEFVEQFRNYHDIVDHVTITVNPNDTVLAIAQAYRFGKAEQDRDELDTEDITTKSRLGAPNVDDISEEDAQWLIELSNTPRLSLIGIDAKTIPVVSKGAHDYWYSSPWVSTDTMLELNIHATPAQRGLAEIKGERGARIWYFPPDYDQRIAVILKQWTEELEQRKSQSK